MAAAHGRMRKSRRGCGLCTPSKIRGVGDTHRLRVGDQRRAGGCRRQVCRHDPTDEDVSRWPRRSRVWSATNWRSCERSRFSLVGRQMAGGVDLVELCRVKAAHPFPLNCGDGNCSAVTCVFGSFWCLLVLSWYAEDVHQRCIGGAPQPGHRGPSIAQLDCPSRAERIASVTSATTRSSRRMCATPTGRTWSGSQRGLTQHRRWARRSPLTC